MKLRIIGILLALSFSQSVFASKNFVDADDLGPYPTVGSIEEKQDIDQLLSYQKTRTAEQCAAAELQANASMEVFFGGKNGVLTDSEISKVKSKLKWLTAKTGIKIFVDKTKLIFLNI